MTKILEHRFKEKSIKKFEDDDKVANSECDVVKKKEFEDKGNVLNSECDVVEKKEVEDADNVVNSECNVVEKKEIDDLSEFLSEISIQQKVQPVAENEDSTDGTNVGAMLNLEKKMANCDLIGAECEDPSIFRKIEPSDLNEISESDSDNNVEDKRGFLSRGIDQRRKVNSNRHNPIENVNAVANDSNFGYRYQQRGACLRKHIDERNVNYLPWNYQPDLNGYTSINHESKYDYVYKGEASLDGFKAVDQIPSPAMVESVFPISYTDIFYEDSCSPKVQDLNGMPDVQSEDVVSTINNLINTPESTLGDPPPMAFKENLIFHNTELEQIRSALDGIETEELSSYLNPIPPANESCINYEPPTPLKSVSPTFPMMNLDSFQTANESYINYSPLTPPKSVSPVLQDSLLYAGNETEDEISGFLTGFDQINRNEFNIYLDESEKLNVALDAPNYAQIIRDKCNENKLDKFRKKISSFPKSKLFSKDEDGDTLLHIYCCKAESSELFYERMLGLHEELKSAYHCCELPVNDFQQCVVCGNGNVNLFYTPLSFENQQGYSPLACSLLQRHSEEVIMFMLDELSSSKMDLHRVFNRKRRQTILKFANKYPALKRYI